MAMIDELVEAVARASALPPAQAALAVGAMLRFMAARLPSPLFGELQSRLQSGGADGDTAGDPMPSKPAKPTAP